MKLKNVILIDRILGKPIILLLNILARVLGFFLRINHSLDKPPKRIVVCKFLGMGGIIQATPLLQTLKNNFPNAEIIFVSIKNQTELLRKISFVHKILMVDDKNFLTLIYSTMQLLISLLKKRINLFIDLELYSYYSSIITTLSCATNRFGFYRRTNEYRLGIYTHMMFFNNRMPISQIYLQMARMAGCKSITEHLCEFQTEKDEIQSLKEKLNKINSTFSITSPYIVINPNASELRIERRWGLEKYAALINLILQKIPDYYFVLIGNKKEKEYVAQLVQRIDNNNEDKIIDTGGGLTLPELIALIRNGKLMITNDSGPLHLALSLHTPIIGLFGPCAPNYYNLNERNVIFYKQVYCSPCVHDFVIAPCNGNNICMKNITIEEVFVKAQEIIDGQISDETKKQNEIIFNYPNKNVPLGIINRI